MGVCNGSILAVMVVVMLLVAVAPEFVLGGGARLVLQHSVHEVELAGSSQSLSTSSRVVGSAEPDFDYSVRKLLLERRRRRPLEAAAEASGTGTETYDTPPPTSPKVDQQASGPSAPPAPPPPPPPPPPPRRQSRFALLFRSLAKGSPTPGSGTPSPGHN